MKSIVTLSFFIIVIASISLSCKKHHESFASPYPKPDSIAFRRYNSASATPVPGGQVYILENNSLYTYPVLFIPAGLQVTRQKLPDSKYRIARHLIDNFPLYLLQHPDDTVIGCPGCSGEKVITLTVLSPNAAKSWQISTDTCKLPIKLRQYIWGAGVIIDHL